jgi:hypothetical protein
MSATEDYFRTQIATLTTQALGLVVDDVKIEAKRVTITAPITGEGASLPFWKAVLEQAE